MLVKDVEYYLNFVSNSPLCNNFYNLCNSETKKCGAKKDEEDEAVEATLLTTLLSPETIEKYLRMMILNASNVPIKPANCDKATAKDFEEAVDAYMPEFEVRIMNLSVFFTYFARRAKIIAARTGTKTMGIKTAVARAEKQQIQQNQQAWNVAAEWIEKLSKDKARMREIIVSECSGS